MHGRRKAREVALQVLYSLNFVSLDVQKALDLFWGNFVAPKEARAFAEYLVEGAWSHRGELDQADRGLLGKLVACPDAQSRYQHFTFGGI